MHYLKVLGTRVVPRRYRRIALRAYLGLRALMSLFYVGTAAECPCCGGRFRRFVSSKALKRANVRCPRCGSLERHRLLWLYLRNRTDILCDRLKVLHVAPEHIFQWLLGSMSNLTYVSADFSSFLADVQMDITDVPFEERSFDVVLCSHVLEHVVDDHQAMRECFRVLKPGGWAILQSAVDMNRERTFEKPAVATCEDRARTFGHPDHVRVYGRDYSDRLESVGFGVEVEHYASEFATDSLRRFGLDKDEEVYLCTRPRS